MHEYFLRLSRDFISILSSNATAVHMAHWLHAACQGSLGNTALAQKRKCGVQLHAGLSLFPRSLTASGQLCRLPSRVWKPSRRCSTCIFPLYEQQGLNLSTLLNEASQTPGVSTCWKETTMLSGYGELPSRFQIKVLNLTLGICLVIPQIETCLLNYHFFTWYF